MERELVDLAKRGDEEAFDALARRVGDRCMAIASWIPRDTDLAEDTVQAPSCVPGATFERFAMPSASNRGRIGYSIP